MYDEGTLRREMEHVSRGNKGVNMKKEIDRLGKLLTQDYPFFMLNEPSSLIPLFTSYTKDLWSVHPSVMVGVRTTFLFPSSIVKVSSQSRVRYRLVLLTVFI